MAVLEEQVIFRDRAGRAICNIRIVCEAKGSIEPLVRLAPSEAAEESEEEVQLLEGCTYEYELDQPDFELEAGPLIRKSNVGAADKKARGVISTGNRTGLLTLSLLQQGVLVATAKVEVRSSKIGYRTDYRYMLDHIVDYSLDLVLSMKTATEARLKLDQSSTTPSIQQQFFFLKGLLNSTEFVEAYQQIVHRPLSRLKQTSQHVPLSKGIRASGNLQHQIHRGRDRIAIPRHHPLAIRYGSRFTLPSHVDVIHFEDTLNIPENQFVKYVMDEFSSLIDQIALELGRRNNSEAFLDREVYPLARAVHSYKSSSIFIGVDRIKTFPFSSPALQQRAGYREVLQAWIKSRYALTLTWDGGEEIYTGGVRDVAKLYEYWVFFILWGVVTELVGLSAQERASALLKPSGERLGLQVKAGRLFKSKGMLIEVEGKAIRAQFSYNRMFPSEFAAMRTHSIDYHSNHPASGSWTRAMQPDFTISFWPDGLSEYEAEKREQIRHVHFDAKYRLNSLNDALGEEREPDGGSLGDFEEDHSKISRKDFKRIDLLKMHAYKDAIRRSSGAYIIYPGVNDGSRPYHVWTEFHEVLPGLGAFCVRPDATCSASEATLRKFLLDVLRSLTFATNEHNH